MEDPAHVKSSHSPLVIRVSVKSSHETDSAEALSDDATSVTLDTFMCGHCQLECVDITEFLGHRLQHSQGHNAYRCELCKTTFSNQQLASDHYLHEHKVDIASQNESQADETDEGATEDIKVNIASVQNISKDVINQDDGVGSQETCERVIDLPVDKVSDVENLSEPEEIFVQGNSESTQMLKFRLHKEEVVGSKFMYGRYVFSCIQCSFDAYSLPSLISHMHKKHDDTIGVDEEGSLEDSYAEETVMTVSEYHAMNARKKEAEQFTRSLKRRYKKQKQDQHRIYTCHICQKIFQRARSLRLHMEIHRTERNFLCDECGKAFKSQIRLNAHRKVHKEKLFQCSQCDFQSSVNSNIHVHRQFHRDGCVLCHVCGSAYTDKSTLKKHMQVHSLDRPFGCAFDGCTWRFKTQAMCKAHLRAHTSKGKFKCDICGYVFRHKHHLQRHQSSMHGVNASVLQIEDSSPNQVETQVQLPVTMHTTEPGSEASIQVVPVQVVVATDMQGTPITYEQPGLVDVNHLILQSSAHPES